MEYSSDKVMTRKEYLKSKRKGKLGIRIVKYSLLLVVIVLLATYLFRQLDIYNNVTKIANKVVEETALARTMMMYYLADSYTKDSASAVMMYKAYDESRSKIPETEGFTNIKVLEGKLYGLVDGNLCYIDLETNTKTTVIEGAILEYILDGEKIYCYIETKNDKETGIYVYDKSTQELKQLINIKIYQFLLADSYIYVISKGKTEKSIIRYNLNGSGRTILTNKEIVTYMKLDKNNVYYLADEQLYTMKKNGKSSTIVVEDKIYVDTDIKNKYLAVDVFTVRDDIIYYINKAEEKNLCAYNVTSAQKQVLSKKNVESIQLKGNILYYKVNDDIAIYKINIESGKSEHVTNIRGTEYICIN